MTFAFRAASSVATTSGASITSLTLTIPSSVQVGDLLLVWIAGAFNASASGWTKFDQGANLAEIWVGKKVAQSGDAGSNVTFSFSGVAEVAGAVMAYSGNPAAVASANSASSSTATSYNAPGVSNPSAGNLQICFWNGRYTPGYAANSSAVTVPVGMTSRFSGYTTSGSGNAWGVGEATLSSTGATPTRTASTTTSDYWAAVAVVIGSSNTAPNAPVPTSPANNATVDRSQPIPLAATFSDPDPGDSPSASQWRHRLVGAGTWTTVTQNNPLQSYSIPAGLAAGNYEWQAAYADQQGVWGPFCGSAFFTAADPTPGPTILDPAAGATISTSSQTFTISTPSLQESEWTLYADDAGAISSTVLQGPVSVTTGDLRSHTFTGLANNVPVWLSVRDKDNGLWSQPVQQRYPVSYTPPASPTLALTPDNADGTVAVGITNPPPGTGQPAVSYNDLYVRSPAATPNADTYLPYSDTGTRVATMLATGATYVDPWPASGVAYEYQVIAVASNGTTSASGWVSL